MELALRRILLIHGVIMTIGGIPLIYLGDELGTQNDYNYRNDPAKAGDSRWVHRPYADWSRAARRTDPTTVQGRLYQRLQQLIGLRKQCDAFSDGDMEVFDIGNDRLFAFVRSNQHERVGLLANFSEQPQTVAAYRLRQQGFTSAGVDLLTGTAVALEHDVTLAPYQLLCLHVKP